MTRRAMGRLAGRLAGWLAAGGVSIALGTAPAVAGEDRIGVGCHIANPEELAVPAAADAICADAFGVVERLAGPGRVVLRVDPKDETAPVPDYPVILVVMDLRPDWTGRNPRLVLHAVPVRVGRGTVTTQLPPASVDLARADWADRAHESLHRMIGFLMR